MSWKDVSAHEMNTLVNEVNRLRTIVDATHQPATTKGPPPRERIVALVEQPTNESKTLAVRQVRYASVPPIIGEYQWDWNYFDVYPAHGFTCEDYGPYYTDPSQGSPSAETIFLRAERRENIWILHPPPRMGAGSAVVVRGIPEDGEWKFGLLVQRVVLPDEGDAWIPTGDTFLMPTIPLTPAIYWQHRILPESDAPIETGDVQLTRIVDGAECVDLYMPLFAITTRSDDPYRGPRPVGP